ncbi:MAG: hypothetical protein ACI841_004648 [Planctomycetota bacterium]|jgi:hypothetical protein
MNTPGNKPQPEDPTEEAEPEHHNNVEPQPKSALYPSVREALGEFFPSYPQSQTSIATDSDLP